MACSLQLANRPSDDPDMREAFVPAIRICPWQTIVKKSRHEEAGIDWVEPNEPRLASMPAERGREETVASLACTLQLFFL